ncbi:hypothetical protein ACFQL4_11895 [Halosimplex aquaticum]
MYTVDIVPSRREEDARDELRQTERDPGRADGEQDRRREHAREVAGRRPEQLRDAEDTDGYRDPRRAPMRSRTSPESKESGT